MGPGLCVRHLRCLHPYAHVRSLGVVEADYALKLGLAFFSGGYGHLVQPFGLQDAVGAFRHSVLEGGGRSGSCLCLRHASSTPTRMRRYSIGIPCPSGAFPLLGGRERSDRAGISQQQADRIRLLTEET